MSDETNTPIAIDLDNDEVNAGQQAGGELPRPPRIPRQIYQFRITEEPTATESKKGNAMLVFKAECIREQPIEVDGVSYSMNGLDFTTYAVFKDGKNITLRNLHKAGGLPSKITIDPESGLPCDEHGNQIRYTGTEFYAYASSETDDDKDEDGNVIVNPITNEPMTITRRRLGNIVTA